LFKRYLAGGTCYQRFYEPSHLKAHPRQSVSKFHVVALDNDPLKASRPNRFTVRFGYWVKNAGAYSSLAVCRSIGAIADCSVESDGGHFTIAPDGTGLKVMLGKRLTVEGSKGMSPDIATGDNRVLLLPKSRKNEVCQ